MFTVTQILSIWGYKNQTHTVTHIAEWREKRCGSGISKKFSDPLIFDEKRLKILAPQRLDAAMAFVISRSRVQVTFPTC